MKQVIRYQVRFQFNTSFREQSSIFPAINKLLATLKETDRLLADTFGLEMDWRHILEEMTSSHFLYTVNIILQWPEQIPLDPWPDPNSLESWTNRIRKDVIDMMRRDALDSDIKLKREEWDILSQDKGLSESISYIPPTHDHIASVINELRTTKEALDDCTISMIP